LDDAEKTLAAAWKLTQNGVAAAHLCQLYLDEHKTQSAMHMCQLDRSRLPTEKEPFLYGVPELIEQNDARIRTLNATAQSKNMSALDEIIAMRDLKGARVMSGTATAQFRLLIAFDAQARAFKVQDVQYLSGSDKLKLASKALLNLNFGFTSPDGNPVRVLRWGTFICGPGGCEFMLPDATAARSTPMPIRSVH
jgi:hypothetical protein